MSALAIHDDDGPVASDLNAEKIIYERLWALLRDRQLMTVFEKYGPEAFRRSSVLEGFETFIKTQRLTGKTIVEIGTLKGLTAIVLARYFERVVTVDIVDDPLKYEIVDLLGVKNIAFVNVRDNKEKAEVISAVNFDAAYVDGDHHADTWLDFDLTKRCGRILVHEYWNEQPAVQAAIASLGGNVATRGKFALWQRAG